MIKIWDSKKLKATDSSWFRTIKEDRILKTLFLKQLSDSLFGAVTGAWNFKKKNNTDVDGKYLYLLLFIYGWKTF